ncbi:hypothetical protein [Rhodococcus sp. BH5]|uniref:hypothetical protein n=1 Tax=Rhodococcus sp. BH5 TaxID=2871702 RepID=UPI0022CD2B97|nr:hypothetical protein [Rhodococcus sp. BH5]MCZ9635006.1 hypothetical protein [Rhodococcus sp. BH5]
MTSEVWSPLLTALLALAGVLFTQYRAERRADNLERRREVREDIAKSHENRRDAYGAFLSLFYQLERAAREWNEDEQGEPSEDALESILEPLTLIRIYGTTAATAAADQLVDWLFADVFGPQPENHKGQRASLEENYLKIVRNDLAIPDVPKLKS